MLRRDMELLPQQPGNYISNWISASDYSRRPSHLLIHIQLA